MKIKKYLLITFILILGLFLSIDVNAEENEQKISLTLQCDVEGMKLSLYKIADENLELQKPFDDYVKYVNGLDNLDTLDSEGWRVLAGTLENNVLADSTKAMSVMKTDEKGTLIFENLSKGLYLIVGTETKDKDFSYTPSPLILSLPIKGTSGEWNNHPVVQYSKIEKEELKEKKNLEVVKIWKDTENKENRPKEITVELLKNGKNYDTVKLNQKNQWKYQWKNLSSEEQWSVVEKNIPDAYQVEYSQNGEKIYIVNHLKTPQDSETSKPEKLPQTGQFWWPVPVLVLAGLSACTIGMLKKKG